MRATMKMLAMVCALFALAPALGVAQDHASTEVRNAISVDVLTTSLFIVGDVNGGESVIPLLINYQRLLTNHFILLIKPLFVDWGSFFTFQPWVEVDWHITGKGLKGFFLGLAAIGSVDVELGGTGTPSYFLGIAPIIGYQFLFSSNIDLSFSCVFAPNGIISVGETAFGFGSNTTSTIIGAVPIFARPEIDLGYRF